MLKKFVTLFFILFSAVASAQILTATSSTDTNRIRIGEQFNFRIDVRMPADMATTGKAKILWPQIKDTITSQVEVAGRSKIDTVLSHDHKTLLLSQTLKLTSFDTGFIVVPPLTFAISSDTSRTFETQPALIEVLSVPVDTTKAIKDIKPPLQIPFTFAEAVPYIITALAILTAAVLLFFYLKKRKPEPAPAQEPPVVIPADERALQRLEEIRVTAVWKQGKHKEFYTQITDVLRDYMEERFKVPASEMTSDELIRTLRPFFIPGEAKDLLVKILPLADLVKFAKEQPLPGENDAAVNSAREFIVLTRQQPEEIINNQEVKS